MEIPENVVGDMPNEICQGIPNDVGDTTPIVDGATTIQIKLDTKTYLDKMKIIKQEPYDRVIKRMISKLLDFCEEGRDEKTKKLIQNRIQEVNRGEVVSTKQLRNYLFGDGRNEIREILGKVDKK